MHIFSNDVNNTCDISQIAKSCKARTFPFHCQNNDPKDNNDTHMVELQILSDMIELESIVLTHLHRVANLQLFYTYKLPRAEHKPRIYILVIRVYYFICESFHAPFLLLCHGNSWMVISYSCLTHNMGFISALFSINSEQPSIFFYRVIYFRGETFWTMCLKHTICPVSSCLLFRCWMHLKLNL